MQIKQNVDEPVMNDPLKLWVAADSNPQYKAEQQRALQGLADASLEVIRAVRADLETKSPGDVQGQ